MSHAYCVHTQDRVVRPVAGYNTTRGGKCAAFFRTSVTVVLPFLTLRSPLCEYFSVTVSGACLHMRLLLTRAPAPRLITFASLFT